MPKSTRRTLVLLALAGLAGIGGAVYHHKCLRWKRFATVTPGELYRSGDLRDWQLRQAVAQFGIKTVFSFTHTGNAAEQALCDELGVQRHFHYLAGNGQGPDEPYLRFLQIAQDPANRPILVHCSAGVQRTGGAVALYRAVLQGWPIDRAVQEMIAMGNEGNREQIEQLERIHQTLSPAADRSVATGKPAAEIQR